MTDPHRPWKPTLKADEAPLETRRRPVGRAAAGESTIYKGTDGRWHGYVSMGLKEDGRRDRRHVSGDRRADVLPKVRQLEAKRDAGTAGAAGKAPTVGQWLEHWIGAIAARRVRPSTLARYRQLAANQLVPGIGHHRLDRLQPEHVETLYGDLLDAGLGGWCFSRRGGPPASLIVSGESWWLRGRSLGVVDDAGAGGAAGRSVR